MTVEAKLKALLVGLEVKTNETAIGVDTDTSYL